MASKQDARGRTRPKVATAQPAAPATESGLPSLSLPVRDRLSEFLKMLETKADWLKPTPTSRPQLPVFRCVPVKKVRSLAEDTLDIDLNAIGGILAEYAQLEREAGGVVTGEARRQISDLNWRARELLVYSDALRYPTPALLLEALSTWALRQYHDDLQEFGHQASARRMRAILSSNDWLKRELLKTFVFGYGLELDGKRFPCDIRRMVLLVLLLQEVAGAWISMEGWESSEANPDRVKPYTDIIRAMQFRTQILMEDWSRYAAAHTGNIEGAHLAGLKKRKTRPSQCRQALRDYLGQHPQAPSLSEARRVVAARLGVCEKTMKRHTKGIRLRPQK